MQSKKRPFCRVSDIPTLFDSATYPELLDGPHVAQLDAKIPRHHGSSNNWFNAQQSSANIDGNWIPKWI